MMVKRLLIVYYTGAGNTGEMAEAIARGAEQREISVEVKGVEECELRDLAEADGIVVGSPTYFSNMTWQVKKMVDESIVLYRKRQLNDKVGGCFTSAGTERDGKVCIETLERAFGLHHGLKMVPGVVRVRGEEKEKAYKICYQYGAEIARQLLS